MKKVHEYDIPPKTIAGKIGSVNAYDIVNESIQAGIRVVPPNSDVPTRTHKHPERQIIYVIEGTAEITNLVETIQLKPGDFVVLEADEEHYVRTVDEEVKVFEIKFP
jgi:quercetin dioxygenase-like cupin family protein